MPRVPTYDRANIAQRPVPGAEPALVRAPNAGLFAINGEQMRRTGAEVQRAADDVNRIALDMQDRDNADAIFRAEAQIKSDYLSFEQAARERRGVAAKGLSTEADDWWTKKGNEIADGLTNPVQRSMFNQTVTKLRQQSLAGISTYEAGERRKALEESAQASIAGSVELAAGQVGTPTEQQAISGAKSDILKRLGVLRQLNGWDENMHAAKIAESLTNLHLQVIQNKINSDPEGARAYFDLNKAEINGSKHAPVEKALKVGTIKVKAQGVVDSLVAQGLGETDGLKVIREQLSGDEEAAAVAEWKTRVAEVDQARERAQRNAADTAWGIFARQGYRAIPATVLAALDGKTLAALRKESEDRAKGTEPKTDSETYYALRQLAASEPDKFRNLDLRTYFPQLSRADREEFIKLQTKPETELKDAATLDQQLSNMHDQLGWSGSDRKKKGDFDRVVTNAINQEQQRLGKKLNYDERQKIIDRFIVEGKVEGAGFFGFGGKQRYFEVAGGAKAGTFTPTIPKEDRELIASRFKARGKDNPTDEEIMRAYRAWKGL